LGGGRPESERRRCREGHSIIKKGELNRAGGKLPKEAPYGQRENLKLTFQGGRRGTGESGLQVRKSVTLEKAREEQSRVEKNCPLATSKTFDW